MPSAGGLNRLIRVAKIEHHVYTNADQKFKGGNYNERIGSNGH
jgi:hypothetical protein